jgi:hypothetical protein
MNNTCTFENHKQQKREVQYAIRFLLMLHRTFPNATLCFVVECGSWRTFEKQTLWILVNIWSHTYIVLDGVGLGWRYICNTMYLYHTFEAPKVWLLKNIIKSLGLGMNKYDTLLISDLVASMQYFINHLHAITGCQFTVVLLMNRCFRGSSF